MLKLYNNRGVPSEPPADPGRAALPPDVVWLDLLKPEASEIAFVEKTTGLAVPTLDELSEIESSSRLRARDKALYLSVPLIYRPEPDQPLSTISSPNDTSDACSDSNRYPPHIFDLR